MRRSLVAVAFMFLLGLSLDAQSSALDGTWQGTFHPGPQQLRVVLEIRHTSTGKLAATIYSPDQGPEPLRVDAVSENGHELHFSVSEVGATWSGVLAPDGNALHGTITQGDQSPLDFTRASGSALWIDPHIHGTATFVSVAPGVQVQVVDWGGSGRTLLLLTGLGNTAHIFDHFAQQLTPHFHVVGMTRRGFGESSIPSTEDTTNYTADRLGEDVVAVISSMHLARPVLIGHSIAGEELSSVATRHPEAISALVYLDAGFPYAFYDSKVGDYDLDLLTLQRQFSSLLPGAGHLATVPEILSMIEAELPVFQRELGTERSMLSMMPPPPASPDKAAPLSPADAIVRGEEKFTQIAPPTLAIFAVPHDVRPMVPDGNPDKLKRAEAIDLEHMTRVADSFTKGVPSATVLRLPHANHYVFLSNEADVLHALSAFLTTHP